VKYYVRVGEDDHEVVLDGEGVQIDGTRVVASVAPSDGTPVRVVSIGSEIHRVVLRRGSQRGAYTLWLDGFRFEVEALDERARAIRELSRTSAAPTGPAPLVAPMPGLIVRVAVKPGDEVKAGQGLVVMEAMKMENELRAVAAGRVKVVHAQPGTAVEKGALLVELE
jgi:acetyl/propionyl-CoA carboxylase alpha subunit